MKNNGVIENSGLWWICIDGQLMHSYPTKEIAENVWSNFLKFEITV